MYYTSVTDEGKINSERFFTHKKSYDVEFNDIINTTSPKGEFYAEIEIDKRFQIVKFGIK